MVKLIIFLLLLYTCGVLNATDEEWHDEGDETPHRSIWEIYEENEKESSKICKGRYGCGQRAESNIRGGDIMVDPDEPPKPSKVISSTQTGRVSSAEMIPIPLFTWYRKLWRHRDIPYLITPSVNNIRGVIVKGIGMIRTRMGGCLKFRPKQPSDKWWLEFFSASGCYSGMGRKYWKTGPTRISLGKNCNYPDIVQHEMLHALGFPHEQSRTDRDKYVQIFSARIVRGMQGNFAKSTPTDSFYFGTPYDYKSIMHYGKTAFSVGGKRNTIERKGNPGYKLGSGVLSNWDVLELKRMYQCDRPDGWSDWLNIPCVCVDDKSFCTRSSVRICFGNRECKSKDLMEYGTQYKSYNCKASQEAKVFRIGDTGRRRISKPKPKPKPVSGWGKWSSYSTCQAKCNCGWGFRERTRKRGKSVDRQAKLCRRKRCGGSSKVDSDFNTKEDQKHWAKSRFAIRTSRYRGGYASTESGHKYHYLKSPTFRKPNDGKCLMFEYDMRGRKSELTAYMEYKKSGSTKRYTKKLPFSKRGTQTGKRAAINIPGWRHSYKLVIKATDPTKKFKTISIDDIFVDSGRCPSGLNVCRDVFTSGYCVARGKKGYCNHWNPSERRKMYHVCCGTCQEQRYRNVVYKICGDKRPVCKPWAIAGECKKNPKYMQATCCKSCSWYGC